MAATTSATTSANPTSSIVLSPAGSGSTLAAVKKTRFVDHGGLQRRWQDVDGAGPVAAAGCNLDMVDGLMGRSLVIQFTAAAADDAEQSLRPRKLRDELLGTENSGWSRPAGLIIDPVRESPPQEAAEAGLCSSSAKPHHDAYRGLFASASALDNYNRRKIDDDVARAALAGKLSDAAAAGGRVPKEEAEGELQNEAASAGLVRKSSECTTTHAPAAEETRDCPRAAVGTEDNAALLAAGALLDLSSSLVDEGYNTSSIGSSTGNVIESEKHPRRKQDGAGEFGSLEPETSGSDGEDKKGRSCTKLKTSDEPKLAQQQTEKRRRIRTAWADFETDVSAAKKRRKSRESNKAIINMASAAAQAANPFVLLGPTQGRKSGEGKKKKSSIVMDVQETSVLPRPAHRQRYRPIEQLMQETPVVDAVYSEEEEEE